MSKKPVDVEHVFAQHYFNDHVGYLHIEWMVDRYWTLVTKEIITPGFIKLFNALVEKGHDDTNKFSWGDLSGYFYYIPRKAEEKRMVMVYTSQSRDYLIILTENPNWDHASHSIHIRRIWRDYKPGTIYDLKDKIKSARAVINNLNYFEDYNDNNATYPDRPGLALYEQIGYDLSKFHDRPRFYGDIRDRGYVLSYDGRYEISRVEGTKYSFTDIQYFATTYLAHLAHELGVDVRSLAS